MIYQHLLIFLRKKLLYKMKFYPINKTIHIELVQRKKISDLIPDELLDKSQFSIAKVIRIADDCEKIKIHHNLEKDDNSVIVFYSEGLETIKFEESIITLVSEKFVVGYF